MKVLITGANGFVGRSLCTEMSQQNRDVRLVFRYSNELFNEFERAIINSIDENTDWSDALRSIGVVVHLAARVHIMKDKSLDPLAEFTKINVGNTLNLAEQAAKYGVRRFIFISSIKVNGEYTNVGESFKESDVPNSQDAYGMSKFEAEQGLMRIAEETGMQVVIIRPPLVYGPGVKANFLNMFRAIKNGIPLPLGAIDNQRSFVYVRNLVSLIMLCIHHPAAANQIFLVSDGNDLSTTELLHKCANALGVKSTLFSIPQRIIELVAKIIGKKDIAQRLCGNLQVDITKAHELLGWEPPFSVDQGLKETADSFR